VASARSWQRCVAFRLLIVYNSDHCQITQHFQRLEGETQYRDVEAIDSSLKTFVDNLPPTFTMLDPDRSYDESELHAMSGIGVLLIHYAELWYLPIHRYYIQTEILHFTIILHVSQTTLSNTRHLIHAIATMVAAQIEE
jgi:hypothetical protein